MLYEVGMFFFFKQKTAYEMRISDWSSDVCSSDLSLRWQGAERFELRARIGQALGHAVDRVVVDDPLARPIAVLCLGLPPRRQCGGNGLRACIHACQPAQALPGVFRARSEEHTSELQSLMRISYAVFRLKKKKHNKSSH